MAKDTLIKEVTLEGQEQVIAVYQQEGGLLTRGVARVVEDGQAILFIRVDQPRALVHHFFLSGRRRVRVENRSDAFSGRRVTWMSETSRFWCLTSIAWA